MTTRREGRGRKAEESKKDRHGFEGMRRGNISKDGLKEEKLREERKK